MSQPITICCRCSNPACGAWRQAPIVRPGGGELACPRCQQSQSFQIAPELLNSRAPEACPLCDCREFFIRKDFPQRIGLLLVILFGAVASVFYYFENVVATFATLGSLVVVDAIIYLFVGRVTVCYRCRAEFRGVAYNADCEPFDLATSEKYSHSTGAR